MARAKREAAECKRIVLIWRSKFEEELEWASRRFAARPDHAAQLVARTHTRTHSFSFVRSYRSSLMLLFWFVLCVAQCGQSATNCWRE